MKIETRKINLINWISTIQEDDILDKVEKIQKETTDWWDKISLRDKKAIEEGVEQLDRGKFLSRTEVRNRIKKKLIVK